MTAWFRDDMIGGPFSRQVHTYRFVVGGDETIVEDRVEYGLPFGPLGDPAGVFGGVGFEGMFRARHTEAKWLLGEW